MSWGRIQLKCDGKRWRTGGEVKGKLANEVGSRNPSHYLGTWCISISTADGHSLAAISPLNWSSCRLNELVRFAERRNLVSARVPSHFKRSLKFSVIRVFGSTQILIYSNGRDGSVVIATRYQLDRLGIKSRWERDFSHPSRPALGPTQPLIQLVTCVIPEGEATGPWLCDPPSSSAEVKERVRAIPILPVWVFMACYRAICTYYMPPCCTGKLIHKLLCLTKGPQPLPKTVLHKVRSSVSYSILQYPVFILRSSRSWLHLLPRLPVTFILRSIFLSRKCFRRQFNTKI